MFRLGLIITVIFFWPQWSQAAVIINEIAWMGDEESANNEWIELHNSSSQSVNVNGWVLQDNFNLNIELEGELAPGSYAVLERTDDNSSSATAFLIYTGALVNKGATLTLRDANNNIADQVAGGESWEGVGGNNDTKETAQYTSMGWVTNTPTPGVKNKETNSEVANEVSKSGVATNVSEESTKNDSIYKTNKSDSGSSGSSKMVPSEAKLDLLIDVPEIIYVNQPVNFSASARGIGKTVIASLSYTWNFGDSYQKVGKEVRHTYVYPGTYVVVLNATYAKRDVSVRRKVTVLPVNFSLTKNEEGDIQIHNDSPYEIDMTGYSISGNKKVVFPAETKILPRSTITIAKERLDGTNNMVALYDNKKNILTSTYNQVLNDKSVMLAGPTVGVEEVNDQEVITDTPKTNSVVSNNVHIGNDNQTTVTKPTTKKSFIFSGQVAEASELSEGEKIDTQHNPNEEKNVDNKTQNGNEVSVDTKKSDTKEKQWPYLVLFALILFVLFFLFRKDK